MSASLVPQLVKAPTLSISKHHHVLVNIIAGKINVVKKQVQ